MTKKQKQDKIKKAQLFDVLNDGNIYSPKSIKL